MNYVASERIGACLAKLVSSMRVLHLGLIRNTKIFRQRRTLSGTYKEAADVIEELTDYVRQIEELRKDGYYLQKTKTTNYSQAIITAPLPQPPMKVGKLHVGKNSVVSITEIPKEDI